MPVNFDEPINRIGTHSMKWDGLPSIYGLTPEDSLPMWVADMDFKPPAAVNEVITDAVAHGVHGYFGDPAAHHQAIAGWMQRRHNWSVESDWIFTTHGLGQAVALCVQAFSKPGEGVILFTPVYHAFARLIKANQRRVVESPLKLQDQRYMLDLESLQASLKGDERILVLCSPHNPGGRIWEADELKAVNDFCERNDLIMLVDEIHHDLVYAPHQHLPMPTTVPESLPRLLMLTATTKTFNIAGALTGNVIIPDDALRAQFAATFATSGTSANRLGVMMATAAYASGDEWLDELLIYLQGNAQLLAEAMNSLPGVQAMPLQATYLAWVDFAGLGLPMSEIIERVEKQARVATNYGTQFGSGGETHLRLNFACRREPLEQAMQRIREALS